MKKITVVLGLFFMSLNLFSQDNITVLVETKGFVPYGSKICILPHKEPKDRWEEQSFRTYLARTLEERGYMLKRDGFLDDSDYIIYYEYGVSEPYEKKVTIRRLIASASATYSSAAEWEYYDEIEIHYTKEFVLKCFKVSNMKESVWEMNAICGGTGSNIKDFLPYMFAGGFGLFCRQSAGSITFESTTSFFGVEKSIVKRVKGFLNKPYE